MIRRDTLVIQSLIPKAPELRRGWLHNCQMQCIVMLQIERLHGEIILGVGGFALTRDSNLTDAQLTFSGFQRSSKSLLMLYQFK